MVGVVVVVVAVAAVEGHTVVDCVGGDVDIGICEEGLTTEGVVDTADVGTAGGFGIELETKDSEDDEVEVCVEGTGLTFGCV
jgi:hypothetical protein